MVRSPHRLAPSLGSRLPRIAWAAGALAAILCLPAKTATAETVKRGTFDDWAVLCERQPDAADRCYLNQNVRSRKQGRELLRIRVGRNASRGRLVAIFSVPLGVYLPSGLILQIEGQIPRYLQLQTCNAEGCHAPQAVDAELLGALKSKIRGQITFEDARRRHVGVLFSLKGFSAALENLEKN